MWDMRMDESIKLNIMEMKYLLSMCGVIRMDKWGNEEVRRSVGVR